MKLYFVYYKFKYGLTCVLFWVNRVSKYYIVDEWVNTLIQEFCWVCDKFACDSFPRDFDPLVSLWKRNVSLCFINTPHCNERDTYIHNMLVTFSCTYCHRFYYSRKVMCSFYFSIEILLSTKFWEHSRFIDVVITF